MCLNPITILNHSNRIDPLSCQQLYLDIPCGKCSECISQYRSEWRIRTYYECLSVVSKGGYMLFDTLTYDNEHIPRVNDFVDLPSDMNFSCFSKYDIQLFFKRLRKRLDSDYGKNYELRYFVASEYGSVKYTARPHYHVLFFVVGVPFNAFSLYVSSCWHNGRTDGIPFRTFNYVQKNTFFGLDNLKHVINYVAKYVVKDFCYYEFVGRRLSKIKEFDYNSYLLIRDLVLPFHLQSQGFGFSVLDFVGLDFVCKYNCLPFIDKDGLPTKVSLPKGFRRKIFYDYHRDLNGRVFWVFNDRGFAVKKKFYSDCVKNFSNKLFCSDTICYHDKQLSDNVAKYYFCYRSRFNVDENSVFDDIVDLSYNITTGLFNYTGNDRPLIKKCYSSVDLGNKFDGFNTGLVVSFDELFDVNYLSNCVYKNDRYDSILARYFSSIAVKGDVALEVDKLKHRLKQKFQLLCSN